MRIFFSTYFSVFFPSPSVVCKHRGARKRKRHWRSRNLSISSSGWFWKFWKMAKNGVFWRLEKSEVVLGGSEEVHVLAVDDSLVDRKVIERLLKITACKVTAVDSGRRALQFLGLDGDENSVGFDGLKVDLIITDYCMPEMTGYELLKKIKGSSTFRETPVVIMSSENVLTRIDRCLEEGAEDFIVKPVKLSDVKRLKSTMFGEGRMQTQSSGINKRKLQENSYTAIQQDDTPSPKSASSPCSPRDDTLSPKSASSPCSPRSFSSSPTSPDYPLKLLFHKSKEDDINLPKE